MLVEVDNRERARIPEILAHYEDLDGCECEILTLQTGDFIFSDVNGSVCFEYKTVDDFITSIKDTRVFNQSIYMYEEFDYHFVIIVGTEEDLEASLIVNGLNHNSYYGAITRLNTYTTVLTAPSTSVALGLMYCQASKCLDDAYIYKRLQVKTPNPAQNLLFHCRSIGEETIKLLEPLNIRTFSDLQQLKYEDLIEIKGIGPKTAELILSYIGETVQ